MLANPIAAELDCMRPSILPTLIEAAGRNAKRGFADVALFEIGPVFAGDRPQDQRTAITAILAPHPARRWDGVAGDDLFALKGDLLALLDEVGAPRPLQVAQGAASSPGGIPAARPGCSSAPRRSSPSSARCTPACSRPWTWTARCYGFEIWLEAIPEPKRSAIKTRPALELSPLMPLSRDFAFVVADDKAAGDLVRAIQGADKALIASARVFDVYTGAGVPEGSKSLAVEVSIQPVDHTLTEAEIDALSGRIVAAAEKAVGAKLRG